MKIITLLILVSISASVEAQPVLPDYLPRTIRGSVLSSSLPSTMPTTQPVTPAAAVFEYTAEWSEADAGYVFLAPGKPSDWGDLISVDLPTGQASIGGSVADWSVSPVGRPLVDAVTGFAFIPSSASKGWAESFWRMGKALFYGIAAGGCIDLMGLGFRPVLGGIIHGLAAMVSCGDVGRRRP